jgi:hypothetical protein
VKKDSATRRWFTGLQEFKQGNEGQEHAAMPDNKRNKNILWPIKFAK